MAVETRLLGKTAADCMDALERDLDGEDVEIVAVGLVVVVDDGEGTWTRTFCSRELYFERLGLFSLALEVEQSGTHPDDEGGE